MGQEGNVGRYRSIYITYLYIGLLVYCICTTSQKECSLAIDYLYRYMYQNADTHDLDVAPLNVT